MTLIHESLRPVVHRAVDKTPVGFVIEIRPSTRTDEQNQRLHASIREVARQVRVWNGVELSEDQWKLLFVGTLYKQTVLPSLNGDGFVVINRKTSRMTKPEVSDLQELVYSFGAAHGVEFHE